jgi:hypothetical protein
MHQPLRTAALALSLVTLPSLALAADVVDGTAPQPQPPPAGAPVYVQPAYGQPAYGQPVYAAPYPQPVYAPRVSAEEQERLASRQRYSRLWRAGAIVFGITYGLTALIGLAVGVSSSGSGQTEAYMACIPIAGPFVDIGILAQRTGSYAGESVLYAIDGVIQIGGAFMLIFGAIQAANTASPVRDTASARPRRHRGIAAWSVLPVAPGASAGVSLNVATF